jgi:hypothetical protein
MAYVYRSKAGTFTIRVDESNPGTVELCLGGMWLCNYESVDKAAAAVCRKETGWPDWDRREDPEGPQDLKDWEET